MNEENQPTTQEFVNRTAMDACNKIRGPVSSDQFKDYILIMLFYKYISDVYKEDMSKVIVQFGDNQERIKRKVEWFRFKIPEGQSFEDVFKQRAKNNIGEIIDIALDEITESNREKLEGVLKIIYFNSDERLGSASERQGRISHLLEAFNNLDLRPSKIGSNDIIGNCYLFLISNFASDAGKRGGEFFTPTAISKLIARLVGPKSRDRICDPTCGSGGLLIEAAKSVPDGDCSLFGQEINHSTLALARMNMLLHAHDFPEIKKGDTLKAPQFIEDDKLMKFDVVVANPPFSQVWDAHLAANDKYKRFDRGTAPKSKGDWAFISHMVESVVEIGGRVGVVVPLGVLFRGSSEGSIRQAMIEENLLDAVIGLPEKLFFGTTIPAAILLFKKGRERDDVLFVDASREFDSGTKQNTLADKYISKIVETYQGFESIEKYSHVATREEIIENEYNLNIPRYVDTFEAEAEIVIEDVQKEMAKTENQLVEVQQRIKSFMRDLNLEI